MKKTILFGFGAATLVAAALAFAADTPAPGIGKAIDMEIREPRVEVVPLAEAMPADKYDFAPSPSQGDFKGVRTFSQQMMHIATINYPGLGVRITGREESQRDGRE